ncbi:MAG TPA: transglycosylase domain-containing protein [Spirochaetia bacterium]|nr:transglycosylase domain-containing protein [Spirochaetia bacterium]
MKADRRRIVRACLLLGVPVLLTALLIRLPWRALDSFLDDASGTRITDRRGQLLFIVPDVDGRFMESLAPDGIPEGCRELFVRLEDKRFFSHAGVDPIAIVRALQALLVRGPRSGASTITMQLARIVSSHPHSVFGKLEEAFHALQIESRLPKDRILTLYLNNLPLGRNARGVGAAAWTYFAADLATLRPAQLLVLAIITRNPSAYDPFKHSQMLITAASAASRDSGLGIDEEEVRSVVLSARSARPPGGAPHFSRYVADRLRQGKLHGTGGELRTTIDSELNGFIEERVRFYLDRYAAARVTNAAVVAIDNGNGEILGWVGSRDFSDDSRAGQVDGVLIRRQSASTLKPFLYARALETGRNAATLLPDSPIEFASSTDETYRPSNFDRRSHGVVRLRTALASSLNVPAVYVLSRVGLPSFLRDLRELGFALPPDAQPRYGLGVAIGNAEVSLLELTRAYSVFPRSGTLPDLRLSPWQPRRNTRIFSPFTAWLICNILSDRSARVTGFGTRTYFRTPFPAMFKSGTSSEFTNLWCVGATPRFTVGAWAGNFDGRTVINKTGSIVPTQLVADVLGRLQSNTVEFKRPPGVVEAKIDALTGQLATSRSPSVRTEYFRSAEEVPRPDTYHAGPGARKSLLLESLLDADEPLRILFPVNGQVFYLDPTVPLFEQAVPFMAAARGGRRISLFLDGAEIAHDVRDPSLTLPVQRGDHVVIARSDRGDDRALFEVR